MLPEVILHNAVSLDGRIDGFTPDIGLFYELASRWEEDATLAGSTTLLEAAEETSEEGEASIEPPQEDPSDSRPLLVVPDSRGRLRNWKALRRAPYWRDMIALCSGATPKSYLEYLQEQHVECILAGDDHVDLREALEQLSLRHDVKVIRVDSGGALNGVLLRAGLVKEVSVLIHPCLAGDATSRSFFRPPTTTAADIPVDLKLTHVEQLPGDVIWLRYEVIKQ
jgi:2,5-diamino-6-(ribosylamino)-4(3H)-pyrimidinone 5'-phosphate reductase